MGTTSVPPNRDGIGGVGFREGALPLVVSITNQGSHGPPTGGGGCSNYVGEVAGVAHSQEEAIEGLNAICARMVQIAVADPPDGDTATCRCYLHAQHTLHGTPGGDNFIIAGRYVDDLVRTADGWRITHRVLHFDWNEGNPKVTGR